MSDCNKSADEDEITARKLMPNVAKLIHFESDSSELKGSTSMSLCGSNSEKEDVEMRKQESLHRNYTNSPQRRADDSVFQDVAKKFLRRAETGKRSSVLAPFGPYHRSPTARSAHESYKENVRPKEPILAPPGTRVISQQKTVIKDATREATNQFVTQTFRSKFRFGQRGSVSPRTQGAERYKSNFLSRRLTQHATRVALPRASHGSHGSRGSRYISGLSRNSKEGKAKLLRKTELVKLSHLQEEFAKLDAEALEEEEIPTTHLTKIRSALTPEAQMQHADPNHGKNIEFQSEENPRRIEQDGSTCLSLNERHDEVRNAEAFIKPLEKEDKRNDRTGQRTVEVKSPRTVVVSTVGASEHGTRVCADLTKSHVEGHSSTKPSMDRSKRMVAQEAYASADHQNTFLDHTTLHRDAKSDPLKPQGISDNKDVPDIPPQEESPSTRAVSATPPRNPLLLNGVRYNRKWRNLDTSQRRLTFDSVRESLSKGSNSSDDSLSSVEFKGRINSAVDILNPDVDHDICAHKNDESHHENRNMTMDDVPIGQAEELSNGIIIDLHCATKRPSGDWELNGKVNDTDPVSCSSKPKTVMHSEGVAEREDLSTRSHTEGKPSDFEEAGVEKDPYIFTISPQARPAAECKKLRGLGKRTWANLGIPIDGGSEWKEGRRVSTRIRSRPLNWWRGEKMLYGRVHSTLCTLIGIKTTSPDPLWPRPKPLRGDYSTRSFQVESFVDDSYCDLLRLAAQ